MIQIQKHAKPLVILLILAMTTFTWGCESSTNAGRGANIGAASGGIIGGIIGSRHGNFVQGALIGAVIGGAGGALIGNYMDKQAAEIGHDIRGARVVREGEGIRVIFDSGILFSTGSATLTSTSRYEIDKLARILNRYHDTSLVIEGHTDNTGYRDSNQMLSEKRADSVANLLTTYGVSRQRLSPVGYGDSRPIETNNTEWGRKQNRRVEVVIYANDDLKRQAQSGRLN
jgi:outer membrane protein OmpA-like peptidoglycan-associated protein